MKNTRLRSSLLISLVLLCPVASQAFTRNSSKTLQSSPELQHAREEVDAGPDGSVGNPMMQAIADSAASGVGRDSSGYRCFRSVKKIIADGLGKSLSCTRGLIYGGAAKDALTSLPQAGFVDDRSKCHTPGVILVYKGRRVWPYRRIPGDTAGHIEVLGSDGEYHSFYSDPLPIDATIGGGKDRRILSGCFVPDPAKVNQKFAKCKAGPHHNYGGKRRKKSGGTD